MTMGMRGAIMMWWDCSVTPALYIHVQSGYLYAGRLDIDEMYKHRQL